MAKSERNIIEAIANAAGVLTGHRNYLTKLQMIALCKDWLKLNGSIEDHTKIVKDEAKQASKAWFPKTKKPIKPGIYHTSKASIAHLGGALGYWNGKRWEKYEDWGDYLKEEDFIWQGDGQKRLSPVILKPGYYANGN